MRDGEVLAVQKSGHRGRLKDRTPVGGGTSASDLEGALGCGNEAAAPPPVGESMSGSSSAERPETDGIGPSDNEPLR